MCSEIEVMFPENPFIFMLAQGTDVPYCYCLMPLSKSKAVTTIIGRVNLLLIIIILLLLYDMDVSCHRPFLPGTSLEPAVIPTAQASSFTLQYFPYYV